VFGEVGRQRPIWLLDAMVLNLPELECARFEILRRRRPTSQGRSGDSLVTDLDEDPRIKRPEIRRPRSLDGNQWPGFEMIASRPRVLDENMEDPMRKPQSWCLVVEEIVQTPTNYAQTATEIDGEAVRDRSVTDTSATES
jgi:hypothetical protein